MNTRMNASKRKGYMMLAGLVALYALQGSLAPGVQAQSLSAPGHPEPTASVVYVPVVTEAGLEELPSLDLSGMSEAWWKDISKQHTRLLGSSDERTREMALQNIIHFTHAYPEQADFKRAVNRLYKMYRFDDNEAYRIMALAALHHVGDARTMTRIHERLPEERSEQVRRRTLFALADYYKHRDAQ